MKIYGVTDGELRTITVINAGVTALFSLATGCLGYWLNIRTSVLLVDAVPDKAKILTDVIEPVSLAAAIVFYLLGIGAWIARGGFIKNIKRESSKE